MKKNKPGTNIALWVMFWAIVAAGVGSVGAATGLAEETSTDTLAVDMEVVNFASQDRELSRLNLYIKILYDDLQFLKTESDSFAAGYVANLDIFDELGLEAASKTFEERVQVKTIDEANSRENFVLKRVPFELSPGEYDVSFKLQDLETQTVTVYKTHIKLRDFSGHELLASDLLFLDDVEKRENGKFVFQPRVSEWQNKDKQILVYFEVYNAPETDSIAIKYSVLDADGTAQLSYEYKTGSTGRITQNFIDIEGETLTHGAYVAKVSVTIRDTTIELEKSFGWYLEGMPRDLTDIDDAIKPLRYLTSGKEYEHLLGLDESEKYIEFVRFWKSRDPTPLTAENELRDAYYDRVAYAEAHYKLMGKEGWRTDRGWVYIMLGSPDNVEREPYNQRFSTRRLGKSVKAIEVWVYHRYNRQLIFYDSNGFGDYQLENPETLYEIID
ncbi:GWxTD domain-containing protein [candidate division KSB1 bacterium]|nr:GWxTD domain-containing protein [candidate division KSB1 bacterium]